MSPLTWIVFYRTHHQALQPVYALATVDAPTASQAIELARPYAIGSRGRTVRKLHAVRWRYASPLLKSQAEALP